MTEERLPILPAATVEFNVLHDALKSGDSPDLAAAKGVAAGAGRALPDFPSLSGKVKSDLVKIAKAERVNFPEDATNEALIELIGANRIRILGEDAGIEPALPEPVAHPADPHALSLDVAAEGEGAVGAVE